MHFSDMKPQDVLAEGPPGALSFSVGHISRALLGSQLALELSAQFLWEAQLPQALWSQASKGLCVQPQADPAQNLSGFQTQRNIS